MIFIDTLYSILTKIKKNIKDVYVLAEEGNNKNNIFLFDIKIESWLLNKMIETKYKLSRSNAFTKKQFHELLNSINNNFSKSVNTQDLGTQIK